MDNRLDNLDDTMPTSGTPPPLDTSAQGGIFSTSDTRIETENLPENVQAPFAAAPASAITQALRTESTVTGDLKLGGNERKGKKWLVILVALLVLVVAGVGIWVLVGNSSLFTPEEKTTYGVTDESRSLFNRYANFLINDVDSMDNPRLANFLANDYTLMRPEAMFAEQIKLDGNQHQSDGTCGKWLRTDTTAITIKAVAPRAAGVPKGV